MKLSASSVLLAGILSASIYTTLAYASPWSCLEQWFNDQEAHLKDHHVSFWHQNAWLVEAYSFTANDPDDPFCPSHPCTIGYLFYLSAVANDIVQAAGSCGATASPNSPIQIQGLAGHV